mgnify:CR=1 FL=1
MCARVRRFSRLFRYVAFYYTYMRPHVNFLRSHDRYHRGTYYVPNLPIPCECSLPGRSGAVLGSTRSNRPEGAAQPQPPELRRLGLPPPRSRGAPPAGFPCFDRLPKHTSPSWISFSSVFDPSANAGSAPGFAFLAKPWGGGSWDYSILCLFFGTYLS